MDKIWEDKNVLKKLKDYINEASKREAICECNYDQASEEWFAYIEQEYNISLGDHEFEMLNDKFTEERSKYPERLMN